MFEVFNEFGVLLEFKCGDDVLLWDVIYDELNVDVVLL